MSSLRPFTDLDQLREHVPAAAYPIVVNFLRRNPVQVRISKPRVTKLGDFRSASGGRPHRVSVNADLNIYAFLVTLVHEFAHYTTFVRHRRWTQPHGPHWKAEYARLMRPFLSRTVFPADLLRALEKHLLDAPSSSCQDQELMRALKRYDAEPSPFLEDIPERTIFRFNNRLFVKGAQVRKRFKCRCLNDRRNYLIDPLAEVQVQGTLPARRAS